MFPLRPRSARCSRPRRWIGDVDRRARRVRRVRRDVVGAGGRGDEGSIPGIDVGAGHGKDARAVHADRARRGRAVSPGDRRSVVGQVLGPAGIAERRDDHGPRRGVLHRRESRGLGDDTAGSATLTTVALALVAGGNTSVVNGDKDRVGPARV